MPEQYRQVFAEFFEIAEVPHGSGNRGPITQHITGWAKKHGFEYTVDEASNIVIKVPATPGFENAPGICLQGHTDMVCVKGTESKHDFTSEPLKLRNVDGWLMASDTTLGADNGMGLALGFAIALDKNVKHGPIELLCTSDEEIGLIGASQLKTCLKSKYLLNLDSEDFGDICVSCAGGFRVTFDKKFERSALEAGRKTFEVGIQNYLGGHSGVEIGLYRANAIKQLVKVLQQLPADADLRLVSISGGTAHNAIPAFAKAVISILPPGECKTACGGKSHCRRELLREAFSKVHEAYAAKEKDAGLQITPVEGVSEAFSAADSEEILRFLHCTPHGPLRISQEVKDFVETSFATTVLETRADGTVHILGSGRSCYEQELDYLYQQCVSLAKLAGWEASNELSRYPGWPAKMDSPIVKITEDAYKKFSDHTRICAIHAGLEAGMICKLHEGMEAISIGPTILSPHSPQERCKIDTVGKCYEIIAALCADIAK